MYICVCKAITESDIRNACQEGVSPMRELRLATPCSSQCGRCAGSARAILSQLNEEFNAVTNVRPSLVAVVG